MCNCLDTDLIHELLDECQQKLDILNRAQALELAKPLLERDVPVLRFLEKERSVYTFGISLLTRINGRWL